MKTWLVTLTGPATVAAVEYEETLIDADAFAVHDGDAFLFNRGRGGDPNTTVASFARGTWTSIRPAGED